MTITSFSNIVVFIIAETIEMRIMAQFAHLAAAGLAGTYVGVFFGFHALLALHAPTFKESAASFAEEKEEAEGEKAASVYPDDPDKVAPRGGCDAGLRAYATSAYRFGRGDPRGPDVDSPRRPGARLRYAHGVTSKPVKYACMLLGLAAVLVLGIVGIPRLDMGMPLYAIFKDGSSPKIFWRTKDAHLPTQFIYVVTEKSDWPTKHPLLAGAPPPAPQYYNLFGQVEGGKNMIKPLPTPPWSRGRAERVPVPAAAASPRPVRNAAASPRPVRNAAASPRPHRGAKGTLRGRTNCRTRSSSRRARSSPHEVAAAGTASTSSGFYRAPGRRSTTRRRRTGPRRTSRRRARRARGIRRSRGPRRRARPSSTRAASSATAPAARADRASRARS